MRTFMSVLAVAITTAASHADDTSAAEVANLPTSTKTATPELTRNFALQAPEDVLVAKTLGSLAPMLTEVERPTFIGMAGPNPPLQELDFATAPESAGSPGICKATVVRIDFDTAESVDRANSDTPMVAKSISTETVFRVVDDPSPLPDIWNEAYGDKLANECKKAGRVIPEKEDLSEIAFFPLTNAPDFSVWLAVRTLQLAIKQTGEPDSPAIKCLPIAPTADIPPECSRPLEVLHSLDLAKLIKVSFRRCAKNPYHYCTSAEFLKWGAGNMQRFWELDVESQIRSPDLATGDVGKISAITIADGVMIAD